MKFTYNLWARLWFVICLACASFSLALAAPNYQALVRDIESRLDQAVSLYQQQDSEQAKTVVSNAYFEVFEDLEGPIRINFSAAKSFELEGMFGEIRKLINAGVSPAELQAFVAKLKQGLAEVLPTLEQGHKLEGHETTQVVGNAEIAPYWQEQFSQIKTNLELAIGSFRAKDNKVQDYLQQAYQVAYVDSQLEAYLQKYADASKLAEVSSDWKTLQADATQASKLNHFSYYTVVLQQDLEPLLKGLPVPEAVAASEQATITGAQKPEQAQAPPAASESTNQAPAGKTDWEAVAAQVDAGIAQAIATYSSGKVKQAVSQVQNLYFDVFEGSGFENALGARDANFKASLEAYFTRLVSLMRDGAEENKLNQQRIGLKVDMASAVNLLAERSAWFLFVSAFLILLREGIEALLIVAAIVAYLVKNQHRDKVSHISKAVLWAVLASLATAVLLHLVFSNAGQKRELLEGFTMFIAVLMLSPMAYWLLSKIEGNNWKAYISGKLNTALSTGSLVGLWLTAFFAVYREGAETVLFYFALVGEVSSATDAFYLAGGVLAAVASLALVFYLMHYSMVKLPLKPFFLVTGIFMYLMALVFAGKGVIELIEGKLFLPTLVQGIPEIPWLGLYPYAESLFAQGLVVALGIVGYILLKRQGKS